MFYDSVTNFLKEKSQSKIHCHFLWFIIIRFLKYFSSKQEATPLRPFPVSLLYTFFSN